MKSYASPPFAITSAAVKGLTPPGGSVVRGLMITDGGVTISTGMSPEEVWAFSATTVAAMTSRLNAYRLDLIVV